jgi:predicted transposase/invertase (TIGR01784 family)
MRTDSIFYQLFQTFPRCFFELIALPPETAETYQFSSVEVKQLAFRLDGVFLPNRLSQPIYFVEVQFQRDHRFYLRFFGEIFLYLHQSTLENDWQGVILYPTRSIESTDITWYREFFDSGRLHRLYLDELDQSQSIGIGTIKLITASERQAISQGQVLIQKIRQELNDEKQTKTILELIETILVYKLPQVSRQEIEAMFSLSDLKQTKIYQEALEEGIEQGIERGREEGELAAKQASIPRLAVLGLTAEQIALALDLETDQVRQYLS